LWIVALSIKKKSWRQQKCAFPSDWLFPPPKKKKKFGASPCPMDMGEDNKQMKNSSSGEWVYPKDDFP